MQTPHPYPLVARETRGTDPAEPPARRSGSVVHVNDRCSVGGDTLAIIAGPCSVEGRDMLLDTAYAVQNAGATMLRGGAFKPRSSPYAFQGLGEEGLALLAEARALTGLPVVTEAMDTRHLDAVAASTDVIQIGARSMQNFVLLTEVGRTGKPVLLKRGLSATIRELLMAAEYILATGNSQVIICERGIRTYETATRNTFDIAAVPVLKAETHLPVIVDPSHAGGRRDLVAPLALAAIAAGADGLIVEVHPNPAQARSDGDQSLTFPEFDDLMRRLAPFVAAANRSLPAIPALRHEETTLRGTRGATLASAAGGANGW